MSWNELSDRVCIYIKATTTISVNPNTHKHHHHHWINAINFPIANISNKVHYTHHTALYMYKWNAFMFIINGIVVLQRGNVIDVEVLIYDFILSSVIQSTKMCHIV
jgi:hypothetical protein